MDRFPGDFLWGATLVAHAVEGADYAADGWHWEQRPGRIRDGSNSQVAAGHFTRFEADFDLARKLGLNALLFSISWSRIQPEAAGAFDDQALAHYAAVAKALADRGIEPVCVLHDVTLPAWFAARGGWLRPDAAALFGQYATRAAAVLAPWCRRWIPLYEPEHAVRLGYVEGLWPPGRRAPRAAWRVLRHMAEAHRRAYKTLRAQRADVAVGIAVRGRACRPHDAERSWDLRAVQMQDATSHLFQEALAGGLWPGQRRGACDLGGLADFIGVAFYGAETVRFTPLRPRRLFTEYQNAAGARIETGDGMPAPEGFRTVLSRMAEYGAPLFVTGNGLATGDDAVRCGYLLDHLAALRDAIAQGLDIRGYFHRSLLDGFEGHEGYAARYGLVHVDRTTLARTPNPSAYLYKDICETGTFRRGTVARFSPTWTGAQEGHP